MEPRETAPARAGVARSVCLSFFSVPLRAFFVRSVVRPFASARPARRAQGGTAVRMTGQSKGPLVVRRETGKEQEVQVLYDEGIASHIPPSRASCSARDMAKRRQGIVQAGH